MPPADSRTALAARSGSRLAGAVCAALFLVCELIARPFVDMAVADDWSYRKSVEVLLQTGHITYNGWAAPMGGWMFYLGALFIRLFGDSYTSLRMTTLIVSVLTVFLVHRTFVRCGVSSANACIAVLALALTPVYMGNSAAFMTDIEGLFAVVVCLYACARALQAPSPGAQTTWIVFAALANTIIGTSRQISWLGVLVMVPSVLWLLRRNRRTVVTGAIATVICWGFIFWCMHWIKQQPYAQPEHLFVKIKSLKEAGYMVREMGRTVLEMPFLLLALAVAFLPELRRHGRRLPLLLGGFGVAYTLVAVMVARTHGPDQMLEPMIGDWMGAQGFYDAVMMAERGPVVLGTGVRLALTILSVAALFAMAAFFLRLRRSKSWSAAAPAGVLSWHQIAWLTAPFAIVYSLLLVPRSNNKELDRYLLELCVIAALWLVRAYQEHERPALPAASLAALAIIALFSIADLHDMFALYRARVLISREFEAAGLPPNTLESGWEYDSDVELRHSTHVNEFDVVVPPHAYVQVSEYRGRTCDGVHGMGDTLIHQAPLYGLAFSPRACAGDAGFAPVGYFRWLGLTTTHLYIVKYPPYKPVPVSQN